MSDVRHLVLRKDEERYAFVYDAANRISRQECLRTLGRFASNPELSFSWYDAAICSQEIRKAGLEHQEANT